MKKNNKIRDIILAMVVLILCFVIGFLIGKFLYEKYAGNKNLKIKDINYLI